MKQAILGLTLPQLQELIATLGQPSYRAKQVAEWIYRRRATSFEEMTNLPKDLRQALQATYRVGRSEPIARQVSRDGTEKYLFRPLEHPNLTFETVYIPDGKRATLCVSSQVGCKMNCLFCATGKMGFHTHLTPTDILNQVLSVPHADELTNIVFMGMGEPLDNYPAVAQALQLLTADYGYGWSPKRITVSTIGPKRGLKQFLDEQTAHLAISIHSAIPEERAKLMPVEKAFHIHDIIETLSHYDFSGQRRLSFEYIVFGGYNDTPSHAQALLKLLKPLDCRVNLIRYHAIPGVPLSTSDDTHIQWMEEYLNTNGLRTTIRRSRGEDISAACGMLTTEHNQH